MRARRRFGQNFLHDRGITDRIVAAINPQPDQHLVEIGPGHGAISKPLLASGANLTMLEIDRDLVAELSQQSDLQKAQIISGDALEVEFGKLGKGPFRVVGNLPYNISSPLIFHCMAQLTHIHDAHFLLQKEVVQRMAAQPGSRTYGRLSVMLQYHCGVKSLFTVPPGAFVPVPKVQSAFVRLTPHGVLPAVANSYDTFAKVVASAFAQRRKQLLNSLKSLISADQLTELGISPQIRPEQLAPQQFVSIANAVTE
ncbi:MAG: 16S rRNA (adenine(1518)-N(6)/adenine(1519)-N(6))-dimethyltransferase RsmA [Lysobacterales bacterium]